MRLPPSTFFAAPLLLLLCPTLRAQATRPDFAAESAIIEKLTTRDVMQADGTGYREREMAVKVQSEAALKALSVLALPFAGSSQRVDILYARVRRPDGTVIDTPPADALEQPEAVTREAPFYSDLKEKQLPIKSLRVGDTLEWKVRITRTKSEDPGQFWGQENFDNDVVAKSEIVELRVPKATAVTVWTNPRLALKPAESDEGTEHIYRWTYTNLTPTAGPIAEAAALAKKKKLLTPDEELEHREGSLPSIAWTTFQSWQAVGEWYGSLERGRVVPDDAIKAKVAELTAGKTTDEDKARAIYAFVGPNVRYIGVAFGVGRYQPHRAGEVLENQYGDCKDKHTLLAAMLTVAGMHPQAVLIGAGIRFNPAVPSPEAFNHLITRVEIAGQPAWLDATQEVAPFRALVYPLRDKPALVIPESGAAVIERTPKDLPFPVVETMQSVGTLDKDGISTSKITFVLRGDDELVLRAVLRQIAPAQYGDLIQNFSQGMGYGGTASHPEFGRPDDTSAPFTFSYDYRREKGGDWDHYKIVPQLKYASLPMLDEKEPPVSSIELGVPRTETSSSAMTIPKGWGAEMPEAIHAKSDFATIDTTYRFENGTVYAERKTVVLKERLPATDWKAYKKFTDAAELGNEQYVQLTRTGASATSPNGTKSSAAPSNTEAAKLIQQAFNSMQNKDFSSAQDQLDKAKALNPTQKNLNGAFAALNYDRGDFTGSIPLYQREVSLHADSFWVYQPLSRAQLITNHRDDAMESLRKWTVSDPTNAQPAIMLASLCLDEGSFAVAVSTLEAAVDRLPPDDPRRKAPALQTALGQAQLRAGFTDAGSKTLTALLADPDLDDPEALNNAAYELANANQNLPQADAAERKALAKLSTESRTWTLDESIQTLKAKSSLLIASWDTMAWILFREGHNTDAETMIDAAWANRPSWVLGDHLGEIKMALGEDSQALHAYAVALSLTPRTSKINDSDASVMAAEFNSKIAGLSRNLSKSGTSKKEMSALTNTGGADGKARTHVLGPAHGLAGTAEYLVLVDKDHIIKVKPIGDKQLAGGAEVIQKAPDLNLVPKSSDARLVRAGFLNCYNGTCSLIFEP